MERSITMKILAIDPSSNFYKSSTTGIVLLDNATKVNHWRVAYGVDNFKKWYEEVGKNLDYDVVVIEKFTSRENDRARDNTPVQTIEAILSCYPEAQLIGNSGYKQTVPDALLKELDLWKFSDKTHHNDLRASARIGLHWAVMNEVYEVIQDIGKKLYSNKKGYQ